MLLTLRNNIIDYLLEHNWQDDNELFEKGYWVEEEIKMFYSNKFMDIEISYNFEKKNVWLYVFDLESCKEASCWWYELDDNYNKSITILSVITSYQYDLNNTNYKNLFAKIAKLPMDVFTNVDGKNYKLT